MTNRVALLLCSLLAACGPVQCTDVGGIVTDVASLECPNSDALDEATLAKVPWAGHMPNETTCSMSWDDCSAETFARDKKRISDLRTWANKIKDDCVRASYLGWAEYAENSLSSAAEEMLTHHARNEFKDYEKNTAKMWRDESKIEPTIPTPPDNP